MTPEARPPFQLDDAGVGHRAIGWRKALSWWIFALGVGGFALSHPDGSIGLPVALASFGAMLLAYYYAATWSNLWSPPQVEAVGSVRIEDGTLSVQGPGRRFSMPLAKITTRTAWQDHRGFVAHFRAGSGDAITVVHHHPEAAQALLEAAGERVHLDRMRLSSWVQRGGGREALVGLTLFGMTSVLPFLAIGAGVALVSAGAALPVWIAASVFVAILLAVIVYAIDRGVAEPELSAGSDGLRLRGAVYRRFVRYADLETAHLDPQGIRLTFRRGAPEVLPMWRHGMVELPSDDAQDRSIRQGPFATELLHKRARILERIQAGIAARGHASLGEAQLALLGRKGRSVDEWRAAMDALLARSEGGYRQVRLDPDVLARVVENAAQPPDRRVGAALALARQGDPAVRERLRFAAQTCVDENLRVSLERAAQGEVAAEELALIEAEAVAHEARAGAPPAGRAAR